VIDAWTIIDTGSSDRTRRIVRSTMKNKPGLLLRRTFKGFGASRSELLAEARDRATYTLMLDADHTLHVDGRRPKLTADCYMLRVNGTGHLQWRLPLLTKSSHPFEYRGAAHSYLATDEPHSREPLEWLRIDGGPGATNDKLKRDRVLLEAEFLEQPDSPRTVFYLARTYDDLGEWAKAISFYRIRASMIGWDQEKYYARYRLGCLLSERVSFAQGAAELLAAWSETPSRIEALRALANAANAVADKAQIPEDALFLRPDLYKEAA
jgi:glycosyltransferase involved in cell wall biosynthesis